ncbi:MAG: energy transducer TonB [Chitinophagales bacterium]
MLLSLYLLKSLSTRYRFTILIVCSLFITGCAELLQGDNDESDKDTPLTNADKMPEYKGGNEKLIEYISREVKYPGNAKDMKIEGTVQVSFVVAKDGSVRNAKIEKGIYSDLNDEALRVVKSMPKWIPGEHKGEKVAVKQILPIRFELPDDKQ